MNGVYGKRRIKGKIMTIYFIGAGPGADDLITIRGMRLIEQCPLCMYAGSLVPESLVRRSQRAVDTAPMVLGDIVAMMVDAHKNGQDVARVHSGDPAIYGAIGEQMRQLDLHKIPYQVVPGVPSFAASAAVLKRELTLAGLAQSIVITRLTSRASPMPETEDLENFAKTRATLAVHLSINNLANVIKKTMPHYGADCPCAVVFRATWDDEMVITGTLSTIRAKIKEAKITRTAMILIGHVLASENFDDSALYSPNHTHILRK